MPKKVIQAKNVVDFSTGTVKERADSVVGRRPKVEEPAKEAAAVEVTETVDVADVAEAVKAVEAEPAKQPAEAPAPAVKPVKVKPAKAKAKPANAEEATAEPTKVAAEEPVNRPAPVEEEPLETRPLTLRQNRYLDESPQEEDWTTEDDVFDTDEESEDLGGVSTFAEVFIPLHDDSTGTIIRKGMVIVSVIVILCCLVAILMKRGQISGVITPDISELTAHAQALSAVMFFQLL